MFNEQYDDHLKDMDDEEFARSLSQGSYETTEITNLKATVERLTAALEAVRIEYAELFHTDLVKQIDIALEGGK